MKTLDPMKALRALVTEANDWQRYGVGVGGRPSLDKALADARQVLKRPKTAATPVARTTDEKPTPRERLVRDALVTHSEFGRSRTKEAARLAAQIRRHGLYEALYG